MSRRWVPIVVSAVALGLLAAFLIGYFERGFIPGDAFTYLAAGERLNAGHRLYALMPGDRPVGLNPPFWTVPLLSPPPIAVMFRPLAILGDTGAYLWWGACILIIAATVVVLLARKPTATGIALILLVVPLTYEIGVGNLNALVLGGLVATWWLLSHRQPFAAGVVSAGVAALKVTPAILIWYFVTQRSWQAARGMIVGGFVWLAISIIGAGLAPHVEYLGIVRQTSMSGSSELSLAGIARFLGVPTEIAALAPTLALVTGLALIWALRRHPDRAYGVTIVTMLAGSPVVNVNWLAILLAVLAPLAWPAERRAPDRNHTAGQTQAPVRSAGSV